MALGGPAGVVLFMITRNMGTCFMHSELDPCIGNPENYALRGSLSILKSISVTGRSQLFWQIPTAQGLFLPIACAITPFSCDTNQASGFRNFVRLISLQVRTTGFSFTIKGGFTKKKKTFWSIPQLLLSSQSSISKFQITLVRSTLISA